MLFGKIIHYHFTVYNRWGEIVFTFKKVGLGWYGAGHASEHRYLEILKKREKEKKRVQAAATGKQKAEEVKRVSQKECYRIFSGASL